VPGGPVKQNTPQRPETLGAKPVVLALLNNHPVKRGANLGIENEIRHPGGRIRDR
jgi:hypothetical protein